MKTALSIVVDVPPPPIHSFTPQGTCPDPHPLTCRCASLVAATAVHAATCWSALAAAVAAVAWAACSCANPLLRTATCRVCAQEGKRLKCSSELSPKSCHLGILHEETDLRGNVRGGTKTKGQEGIRNEGPMEGQGLAARDQWPRELGSNGRTGIGIRCPWPMKYPKNVGWGVQQTKSKAQVRQNPEEEENMSAIETHPGSVPFMLFHRAF